MDSALKIAILISGRGSNMQKLVETAGANNVQVVLVAADKDAEGINWADKHGLTTCIFQPAAFGGRHPGQETALADAILASDADFIFLAGYMAILSEDFVNKFTNKIINIHPSLLPKYKGLNTHGRALENAETMHGATVHIVTAALDDGPILLQGAVPIQKDDDEDSLAKRVLAVEHIIYPEILSALSTKALEIHDGTPKWDKAALTKLLVQYPNLSIGN